MNGCCYQLCKMIQFLFKFSSLKYWLPGVHITHMTVLWYLYSFSGIFLYIFLIIFKMNFRLSILINLMLIYKKKLLEIEMYWKFEDIFFIRIFVAFPICIYSLLFFISHCISKTATEIYNKCIYIFLFNI